MYKGTFDAYKQISRTEGVKGLYKGFWISCFQVYTVSNSIWISAHLFHKQVVSGVCYVSTYEGVRYTLERNGVTDLKLKALVGGSCASLGKNKLMKQKENINYFVFLFFQLVKQSLSRLTWSANTWWCWGWAPGRRGPRTRCPPTRWRSTRRVGPSGRSPGTSLAPSTYGTDSGGSTGDTSPRSVRMFQALPAGGPSTVHIRWCTLIR